MLSVFSVFGGRPWLELLKESWRSLMEECGGREDLSLRMFKGVLTMMMLEFLFLCSR